MGHRQAYCREARALIDDAGYHLPQRQFPCAGRAQRLWYPQASGDVVHGPHGTKRRPLFQRDRVLEGPEVLQRLLMA